MKTLARSVLLLLALLGLFSFITAGRAQKVLSGDSIPSETEFQKLQYCLQDSDCQIVRWDDCTQCSYARAVNTRWANYFHDNADYYQYPISFNTYYCQALIKLPTSTATANKVTPRPVACQDQFQSEQVVGSGCDRFIHQCYAQCKDLLGRTHKCTFDSYLQRLTDTYVPQLIVPTHEDK